MMPGLQQLIKFIGIEKKQTSHTERLVAVCGGFIGMIVVLVVDKWMFGLGHSQMIIASVGASSVLLFGVPHGQLSQPWPVFGGHMVSAIVGVTCAKYVPNEMLAISAAVALAIIGMYYLRCLHPPGGATAMFAVVGGPEILDLGYYFVLAPVMLNMFIIIVVAVIFNYPFVWRRYPLYLQKRYQTRDIEVESEKKSAIDHSDYVYALSQLDSYVDVSEFDLERIYSLATQRASTRKLKAEDIKLGSSYSNGQYGESWSIRLIVDESPSDNEEKDEVIYKVIAGHGHRRTGCVTRTEFSSWARHEVIRDDENWKRVTHEKKEQE